MRIVSGGEKEEAVHFLHEAAAVARHATCLRAKCGSVVVNNGKVIGKGFNAPPRNSERQRRCSRKQEIGPGFKSDATCCIHAEQRAVMDALKHSPDKIEGSRLYFIRLNESGEPEPAGEPYCTICSKMCLDAGVKDFVLWHAKAVTIYDAEEYNDLSFQFGTRTREKEQLRPEREEKK